MSSVSAWLDRYLDVRAGEMAAGADPDGPEMAALLAIFNPEGRYVDMPSGKSFKGRDELREMFIINYAWADDQVLRFDRRLIDGQQYALEGEARGSNKSEFGERGRPYVIKFACVGSFDDQGRVMEHRDYWDMNGWLAQIATEESTPTAADEAGQ